MLLLAAICADVTNVHCDGSVLSFGRSDDLSRLPWLVAHARRTLRVIRRNITFALGVKLVFVGLTFRGHASLWGAIAADMGVSLLVIANALRLLPKSRSVLLP